MSCPQRCVNDKLKQLIKILYKPKHFRSGMITLVTENICEIIITQTSIVANIVIFFLKDGMLSAVDERLRPYLNYLLLIKIVYSHLTFHYILNLNNYFLLCILDKTTNWCCSKNIASRCTLLQQLTV